jgi:hypothetical protein
MKEEKMTELPDDWTGAKLHSLHFNPVPDSGKITTYRAIIKDEKAAGSPEYALSVSIATPIFRTVSKDFIAFLGEMMAAFKLLSTPVQTQVITSIDAEETSDVSTGITIEPNLLRINQPGPVGVASIVLTSIGRRDHVGPHNNNHYWTARSGFGDAWVYPRNGSGQIWQPHGNAIGVNHPNPGHLPGVAKVNVGSKKGMTYYFDGSFDGPYNP